ncbi:conserved Plasmodium protein, unknown function [Plasmodium malariae]|uniref:Fusion protein n=1 Tax=Plasmodium malariae TaxID=5858 RepID=A0A1D3PB30_PLAMA|nr:conserved Plasmodium protein, unknown function [Plasmodium malariae]SCN12300.1 conserved Plasmodium protein, unknown function [Plasmodium malariae]
MLNILTFVLFYTLLNDNIITNNKLPHSIYSYVIHNNRNVAFFKSKHRKAYVKKKTINYEDGINEKKHQKKKKSPFVTQKDISHINTMALALLEFKKLHNNLMVPENYILKSEDNENLKNYKLWKKLQDIKNEKSDKKKKYIYLVLKKMDFPLNTIFSKEEIENFETDDVEITTMSHLSTEENVHFDFDERQEVRKELFSPYIKKAKDKKGENVKDFLALYKFIPKISEQSELPPYSNRSVRKKGILKYILEDLKKDEIFNSHYNYYYDNIYNNVNDDDINDYFKLVMKFRRSNESYDFFVNRRRSFFSEENRKEKKFFLYTRKEIEGAHSYDFDKWSFSDFVEALVFFNELYLDLNKEKYEQFRKGEGSEELDITDFNSLDPGFVVPSDNVWPQEWHSMPLGMYINQVRMGDIDAKFHFIRRKILDYLMLDFKSEEYENKYIDFTFRKLFLGLGWFIHTRGHPITICPFDKIQFDTFSMDFCKPEEIQGLHLGYLVIQAQTHEKIFWNNYRDRFEFMKGLEINIRSADDLIF